MSHSDLIDTTEMYLRTVYELEEEGIVPLRARIAERLHQSGPTVSQTVARMERDGLLTVQGDRHLELSPKGRALATRVMRKHRLAERLLVDVIGLDWELVHVEACRWEHVISDDVERRLVTILGEPTVSPYGNPIPGLAELGYTGAVEDFLTEVESLEQVVGKAGPGEETKVVVRRISEPLQTTPELMEVLRRAGALPGQTVTVTAGPDTVQVRGGDGGGDGMSGDGSARIAGATAEIAHQHAGHIFVRRL
ncbi:DtxR family transcriptional regulator, Mn-dependent transcriptional regulator [Actinopolymorpha cephalotaxi]|uniref:DtxR family Mn-dependent transcriptional regulator n=1 Tax=Actinopolymorpha cephalotaxi TaxID=504797 RepID=A0A1I2LI05_9ACTN|nr:metal-dependent transcriptional regulator [Actinopolymorpha cephalotaxi]NYH81299.1 DtxR family Mn-dependent transcriptional regulator [Actinopolymorpha cephalotaxi]SFF78915.1 DtxR family transcriptional regulator, Mn-dependent transcriptional regulator [Actinopolymorpha cephalotaxi]